MEPSRAPNRQWKLDIEHYFDSCFFKLYVGGKGADGRHGAPKKSLFTDGKTGSALSLQNCL
jgi:hypothetical protein